MNFNDRKRPIHIHPIERDNMPVILFLTVCSKDKGKIFNNSIFHDAVRKAWIEADAWQTGYYMIMPDHIHWFCTPGRFPIYNLKQWIKYWKRVVTINYEKQLEGRCPQRPNLWEKDFWDTQMRSFDHYIDKLNYAEQNPVVKELVNKSEDWPYQGYINKNLW